MNNLGTAIIEAVQVIKRGGLVVYPTEAVFGLGGDYNQAKTVTKILNIKQRDCHQGLILVAGHIQYLLPLIQPQSGTDLAQALHTWPGHHTWVFPASPLVPEGVKGPNNTVAIRLSCHPVINALTSALQQAVISTSANTRGQKTARELTDIQQQWGSQIDYYLDLPLGTQNQASSIHKAGDGEVLR